MNVEEGRRKKRGKTRGAFLFSYHTTRGNVEVYHDATANGWRFGRNCSSDPFRYSSPSTNLMSFEARLGWQVNRFSICVAQLFDCSFDFYFFLTFSPLIGFCPLLNYPKNTFPFLCFFFRLPLHPVKLHPNPREHLQDADYCP